MKRDDPKNTSMIFQFNNEYYFKRKELLPQIKDHVDEFFNNIDTCQEGSFYAHDPIQQEGISLGEVSLPIENVCLLKYDTNNQEKVTEINCGPDNLYLQISLIIKH